jgi:urease accessory protein UreE
MNYIVSVLLDDEAANQLGKRGSENSLTYYNGAFGGHRIVALSPTSMADKFYAVAEAMLLSDAIVVGTKTPDRLFGEVLVACSLLDKKVILTGGGDVSALVNSIKIKGLEYSDRFGLAEIVVKMEKPRGAGCRVDVDKAFPVQGIGTVALGFVTKGSVKVHDKLRLPSGAEMTVKSIQSNDVDIAEAETGTRVGLALKGARPEDMKKGDLLAYEPIAPVAKVTAALRETGIAREEMQEGASYGFVSNFSYTNATVLSVGKEVALRLYRPLPLQPGDAFMLVRGKEPRIFASGAVAQA